MTSYNVRHNFTATWRLLPVERKWKKLEKALRAEGKNAEIAMQRIFDDFMVSIVISRKVLSER